MCRLSVSVKNINIGLIQWHIRAVKDRHTELWLPLGPTLGKDKGKGKRSISLAVRKTPHRYGNSMQYGITQCYLPPGRGDIPTLTPAEAGTRISNPEGCKAELPSWLVTYWRRYTCPKTVTHPCTNRARRGFVHATNATPPTLQF